MSPAESTPSRIGDVLPGVLKKAGVHEQVQRASVVDQWADRVGDAIARVASPQLVTGSVLVVEVRSSAWLNELSMMKHEILRKLNEDRSEGRIDGLRFVLTDGTRKSHGRSPSLRGAE